MQLSKDPGRSKAILNGQQASIGLFLRTPRQNQGDGGIAGTEGMAFTIKSIQIAGDLIEKRITDFVVGTDRLVVDQMLTRLGYAGSDPIGDGYLSVFDSGADILVTIDPDGSGGPAVARLLAELTGIPTSNAQELFF